jgi:hypothetical protein
LHRFAVLELQFGKTATTIPVVDGEPGHGLQLDAGWVGWLVLPHGQNRRFTAWIFTAVRSRHRSISVSPGAMRDGAAAEVPTWNAQ